MVNSVMLPIGTIILPHIVAITKRKEDNEFKLCDGRVFNPTEWNDLFQIIGNNFGGTEKEPKLPNIKGALIKVVSKIMSDVSDVSDVLEQLKVISDKQEELVAERNKILKENNLTWSLEKCREMKCKHIKGCKSFCNARGITSFCVHDWILPTQGFAVVFDEYKKEVKEKEEIVITGIKYLIGGYGKNKDRFNTVIKETPKYYKLDNGDRVRKDTMCTDMGSTQWQNFNYRVRVATEEEIKQNTKE